ncbi:hypothetical protein [Mycobacterium lepromatosis]|uniref:hypothetical protein n=1 Tax=Mycobacterium lepromatosis TaxID=480418 RepID=UPI0009E454A9|nr:hypothetical protein [Mycobacterium lepromatosis]
MRGQKAVLAGVAVSAIRGAQWVGDGFAVELVVPSARPQRGLSSRNETVVDDQIIPCRVGLPVTTLARTAYDRGRLLSRGPVVAQLDALMRVDPVFGRKCAVVCQSGTRMHGVCDGYAWCLRSSIRVPRLPKRVGYFCG